MSLLLQAGAARPRHSMPRSPPMRRWLFMAVAAWTVSAAAAGTTVAVGGALRDDNTAVWGRIVELAGGSSTRFAVFATASEAPEATAARIVANLQRHGAVAEALPVAPALPGIDLAAAVRDARWIAAVERASGVFFSGGEQARIVDTLQPGGRSTPLLDAVRALLARGGVVAGTSSGAAVMSELMFRDAPDVLAAMKQPLRDGIEVGRGLGFMPAGLVVDQHFTRRGRIGRLLPLLHSRGISLGIGVEEDSAVVVRGSAVDVIGSRGAIVADLSDARHDPALGAFNLRGVRLHWLESGDHFDLAKRTVRPGKTEAQKRDPSAPGFKGYFTGTPFYADMLGDNTLVLAMQRLVDSNSQEVFGLSFSARPAPGGVQADLGFEWRLYKAADTLGWTVKAGDDGSVANLRLDVQPVRLARPLYVPYTP
jgi:cyanophycinase